MQTTQLAITGMTCQNCARHAREALARVPGVADAQVNLAAKLATVRWSGDQANQSALLNALVKAGYAGTVQTTTT